MAKTAEKKKKKQHKIVIDWERCKGCYLCAHVCPKENISVSKKLNAKGYHPVEFGKAAKCTGCGMCMLVCPDLAIEVYDEE